MRVLRLLFALSLCSRAAWAGFSDGVSDDRLRLPSGPGSLEGVGENVSINPNMGVMEHHVPFALPAGFPDATPSLGLSYSSGSGSSEVGVGWSLTVPSVERMTARGLPQYLDADSFVADGGEELVKVDPQAAYTVYRARFEGGFVRWLWHSPGAAGYWEAQYPDGTRGFFGADRTGTIVPEANMNGSSGVFRYQLVETVDVLGHRVRYDYVKNATGYAFLSRISWLFYDDTAGLARYSVELGYETRADLFSDCSSGVEIDLDQRVHSVDIYYTGAAGKERVRGYLLSYSPTAWLSQLTQVQQFGLGDTANANPFPVVHSFGYTQTIGATAGQSLVAIPDLLSGVGVSASAGSAILIDLNGDSLPDVIDSSAPGKHRIWLSQLGTNGTHHLIGPTYSALGDSTSFPLGTAHVTPMDVNGDGFTDLINDQTAKVLINNGSGDWARIDNLLPGSLDLSQASTLRFYDYDGDKRIDVLQTPDATTTFVFHNNGDGSFTKIATQPLGIAFASEANAQMADLNGDGLLDVVLIENNGTGQIRYKLNLGYGNWSPAWITVQFAVSAAQLPNVLIEDINGDALRDVLLVDDQGNVIYMLNRNGSSFDLPQTISMTASGAPLPVRGANTAVVTADMNGNGTQDVVWVDGSSGQVTYLDLFAVRPNLLTHLENGIGRVTDITYTTTVMEMARAREAGSPWKYRLPFAMTVVDQVDEWDRLTNLHELTAYQYDDGYYDGIEHQYRGHAHVLQTLVGDASQEDGTVSSNFDVGATDVYLHGRLLEEQVTSAKRLLTDTTHQWDKCPVELEVASPQLAYPIVNVCETKEQTAIWEGTQSPVTTEVDTQYDGFGNVIKQSNFGVASGCDMTCSRPAGAFGEPCGMMCLGDESYEETQYVPRANTNGAWIVHAPYRSVHYGVAGGAQTETLTYYDGAPFQGLANGLTSGLPTRTTVSVSATDPPIAVSRVSYDANGMVTASLDPNNAGGDMTAHLRTYGYDADGLRPILFDIVLKDHKLERKVRYDERFNEAISSTSWMTVSGNAASGENASTYDYDSFGRATGIHEPDPATGLPAAMPTKWFTYDLKSPASKITSYSTLNGERSSCVDGRGRAYQSRTRTAQGNYLVGGFTIFNTRGAVVQSYQPYSSSSADCDAAPPMGTLATRYRYDAAHRPLEIDLPDDAVYQTASKLTATYLPLETQELDALDNDPTSAFFNTPTIRRVDGLGRVIALGRTLMAGSPAAFTTVTYDELGRTLGYVDAGGHVKTQLYDLAGRLVEIDDPNSGKITLSYDAAGSLTARTDARGATIRLSYDDMNRPLGRWDDADQNGTMVTAIYDADPACAQCSNGAGRMVGATYPDGKDSAGYDVRGRGIYSARTLEGFTFESAHAFDDRDRLTSTTYPDGRMLGYSYDDAGRLAAIGGVLDSVVHDGRGLLTQASFSNGTVETLSYDDLMRAASRALATPNQPIQTLSFTRDRVGNFISVTDPDARLNATYSYDAWYRTVEVALSDEKLDYQFDVIDNVTSAISDQGDKSPAHLGTYQYDPARPNAVTQAGELALAYDAAGNTVNRGKVPQTWDAFGRLSKASLADGDAVYKFGPGVTRAIAVEPHAVTHYVSSSFEAQDGLGVIYVRAGQSRLARLVSTDLAAKLYTDVAPLGAPDGKITAGDAWIANASANGVLPAQSTSPVDRLLLSSARRILYENVAQSTWFGHDQLDSITVETDDQGAVIGRHSYYPFGADRAQSGDVDRHGFTNQETDATGALHFAYRQLDATLGRWSSTDPAFAAANRLDAFGEATTAYAYVANNPANAIDPTGLGEPCPTCGGDHSSSSSSSSSSHSSSSSGSSSASASNGEAYRHRAVVSHEGRSSEEALDRAGNSVGQHPSIGVHLERASEEPQSASVGNLGPRTAFTTTTARSEAQNSNGEVVPASVTVNQAGPQHVLGNGSVTTTVMPLDATHLQVDVVGHGPTGLLRTIASFFQAAHTVRTVTNAVSSDASGSSSESNASGTFYSGSSSSSSGSSAAAAADTALIESALPSVDNPANPAH
jgi:RHS repeat-associated protein